MALVRPEDLLTLAQTRDSSPRFVVYLEAERDAVYKNLGKAADPTIMYRMQGDLHRLNTLIDNLKNAGAHLKKLAATK